MIEQIKGWIVTNGYLDNKKFDEITKMYIQAATNRGICLRHLTTAQIPYGVVKDKVAYSLEEKPDFVIFLDKDVRLARAIESKGIRVFNSAEVIEICDDKARTFEVLANKGIKMPDTIVSPLVFPGAYKTEEDQFIDHIEDQLQYPIVVKSCSGSFGQQVYLVEDRQELISKRQELIYTPHIYQEFIASSKGRDVRIHVVGRSVIATILRESTTDFRANLTQGGEAKVVELPTEFYEMTLKVAQELKSDFLGIDIMFGEAEEPILCEVNSNAHIKNIKEYTGIDVAEYIIDYILEEIREEEKAERRQKKIKQR